MAPVGSRTFGDAPRHGRLEQLVKQATVPKAVVPVLGKAEWSATVHTLPSAKAARKLWQRRLGRSRLNEWPTRSKVFIRFANCARSICRVRRLVVSPMKGCEIAFSDRGEAGRLLAARLASMKLELPVVYALPRGGVPVALEISRALQAPLDLVMVRKIGAPFNPEVALGAVAEGTVPQTVLNESVRRASGADDAYIERRRTHELAEMERRRTLYLGDRARVDPTGRTAILVDDGLATGATMKAALAVMRQQGAARIVVALPVAPEGALAEIESLVDDVVCLNSSRAFRGVGDFFADFHQLTDEETIGLLRQGWGEISPQHSTKRPANGGA